MRIDLSEPQSFPIRRSLHQQGGLRLHPGRFYDSLLSEGYASIAPSDWDISLECMGDVDWATFSRSWDRLTEDRWMGDGGRYRRRRFASFAVDGGDIRRKPHQAHFQRREHNQLNGGVARWFSPVEEIIGNHAVTYTLLRIGEEFANALTGWTHQGWHAELHQFRIDATCQIGKPTPEGLHRDGVTGVMMMLIGRRNVSGGTTTLLEQDRFVAELELAEPLQAIVLDDTRLHHCVSPVTACEKGAPAWRDALVITFLPERYSESLTPKETSYG